MHVYPHLLLDNLLLTKSTRYVAQPELKVDSNEFTLLITDKLFFCLSFFKKTNTVRVDLYMRHKTKQVVIKM